MQAPYYPNINGIPICYACRQEIYEPYMVCFKLNWHLYHLACNLCKKDFSDGRKVVEGKDGYAYCGECYTTAFAPKCARCDQIIEGQMVKAGIHTYHTEHFTCQTCDKAFGGVFFTADNGYPYCEQHYYQAQGMWCKGCDAPIVAGKRIVVGKYSFHTEHFLCFYCKEKLAGRQYYDHQNECYCKKCYLQLFG